EDAYQRTHAKRKKKYECRDSNAYGLHTVCFPRYLASSGLDQGYLALYPNSSSLSLPGRSPLSRPRNRPRSRRHDAGWTSPRA
ncbi:unnamed protein product, partial [Pylaiella littoralis]